MLDIGLVAKTAETNVDPPQVTEQVKLYVDPTDTLMFKTKDGTVSPATPLTGLNKVAAFWQTVADVAGTIAANNGKVLFETPSSNNTGEITTTPGSGDLTVSSNGGGLYEIDWGVSGVEPNAFGLFINGAVVTGTIEGSGAGTQQNNGGALVLLAAGDVVSLRTVDCGAVVTLALAGTTNAAQNVAHIKFRFVSS